MNLLMSRALGGRKKNEAGSEVFLKEMQEIKVCLSSDFTGVNAQDSPCILKYLQTKDSVADKLWEFAFTLDTCKHSPKMERKGDMKHNQFK